MPEGSFLGSGMKFPPQIDPATGRFVVASDRESVKESVYLILMTQTNERLMRPEFGSHILSYSFMDISSTNINMLIREVTMQILSQEPRVRNVEVTLSEESTDSCLIFDIGYTIRNRNVRDNLVFPFYLNTANEEDEEVDIGKEVEDEYEPQQEESDDGE